MGYIKSEAVRKAMEKVPREEFLPPDQRRYAYLDQPLPIEKDKQSQHHIWLQ